MADDNDDDDDTDESHTSSWRVAASLLQLRDQVNAQWPNRSKENDGTIGDERHQNEHSEHNPDANGVVRAEDLTNDPPHGLVSRKLAEALIASRDPRILYVISNSQICSSQVYPWHWRSYEGSNPHIEHMHISVVANPHLYDSRDPWKISVNPGPLPPIPPPSPVHGDRFEQCMPGLLEHEGGNDDDPRDPGGRTSRGIIQSEWDEWRKAHHGLPEDVWDAPQSQVLAIYRQKYWDALSCDALPPGIDYAVFDFGVNSGITRSAKMLQGLVGTATDGMVGPITIAATKAANSAHLIEHFCDMRLTYLKGLGHWDTFGRGWSRRVADVKRDSLAAYKAHNVNV